MQVAIGTARDLRDISGIRCLLCACRKGWGAPDEFLTDLILLFLHQQ